MKPVTLLIAGAGGRGAGYAKYAASHPDQAQVVAVAEPRAEYRQALAAEYKIPAANVFDDWRAAAAQPRLADAVIIATQDRMHTAPALAFAALGYHILLEKPMAPTPAECLAITRAVTAPKIVFAVCHVLRYTQYTRALKAVLDAGRIGEIVSIQHIEPVGYWHQAHSFVRGNWRNTRESSCMLLAKCCHDLDWLRYLAGASCQSVSSFGNLKHFRRENQPAGAAARCLDCRVEADCPYSAVRIYLGRLRKNQKTWPLNVITTDLTETGVTRALREGPYGRCVYRCDNDVVDHQVVNMLFENGVTAAMTMTAFAGGGRATRICGTRGELRGNATSLTLCDFLTDKSEEIAIQKYDTSILGGHGGGDFGLMHDFIAAVAENNPARISSGPQETCESHMLVFAAEQARLENRVVELRDFMAGNHAV